MTVSEQLTGDPLLFVVVVVAIMLIIYGSALAIINYMRRRERKKAGAPTQVKPEEVKKIEMNTDVAVVKQVKPIPIVVEDEKMKLAPCPICEGRGEVYRLPKVMKEKQMLGETIDIHSMIWEPCNACNGTGYVSTP